MKIHCKYDKLIDPKTLKHHPKNRNKHDQDQIDRLAKILKYQGWRYAIKVSNQSKCITSGHGRTITAIEMGLDKVPVVYQDYEDSTQEYADVQSDNAIAAWAELDLGGIGLDVSELGPDFDVELLGIKGFEIPDPEKDAIEDEVPTEVKAKTKLGHLYRLGNHKLLCGDSTDAKAVSTLVGKERMDMVFTDPPYGMNLDTDYSDMTDSRTGKKGSKFRKVIDDDKDFDPRPTIELFDYCKEQFWFGGDYYAERLPNKNEGSWVVWNKRSDPETTPENAISIDRRFGSCFELVWSRSKHRREMARVMWSGKFVGNVARKHDKIEKHIHPTQKPVALPILFFERWGKSNDKVIDLYGGSGSTLIACEKTNRKCFMMELDPHYCDVIVARWEKYSGKKAELINGKA